MHELQRTRVGIGNLSGPSEPKPHTLPDLYTFYTGNTEPHTHTQSHTLQRLLLSLSSRGGDGAVRSFIFFIMSCAADIQVCMFRLSCSKIAAGARGEVNVDTKNGIFMCSIITGTL